MSGAVVNGNSLCTETSKEYIRVQDIFSKIILTPYATQTIGLLCMDKFKHGLKKNINGICDFA